MSQRCACGEPLHYQDPRTQRVVEDLILVMGANIEVEVIGRGRYLVPRHYIALHGLVASELPSLADKYGFPRVGQEEDTQS